MATDRSQACPAPRPTRRERLEPSGTTPAERLIAAEVRKARGPPPPTTAPAPSPLLARAAAFLPALAAANEDLAAAIAAAPPGTFDVEAVDEAGGGPHVEMEVACGVLDLKDDAAVRAAEAAVAAGGGGLGGFGEEGGTSSDDSSEEGEGGDGEGGDRPPSRHRRAAGIQEVG